MGVTQNQVLALVDENLKYKDTEVLDTDEKQVLLNEALDEFSRLRPKHTIEVKTGNTTGVYDLPTDWQEGMSTIDEIEYPIQNSPKTTIPDMSYYVEDYGAEGKKLRFDANKPADAAAFWLRYTIAYSFDSNGDSDVPVQNKTGLAYLATSLMCSALASFFAAKANPTLPNTEVFGYTSRVEEYSTLAGKWMKKAISVVCQDVTGVHGNVGFIDESYWDRTND